MRGGPTEGVVVEQRLSARRKTLHVQPEQVRTCERFVGLDMGARFARRVATQQKNDPSVERPAALRGRIADCKFRSLDGRGGSAEGEEREQGSKAGISHRIFPFFKRRLKAYGLRRLKTPTARCSARRQAHRHIQR